MNYTAIHDALIIKNLNWSTAALAMTCSPASVMNVAARRSQSSKIARGIAALISRDVAEIMAKELERDEDWINSQLKIFESLAQNYLV